MQVTDCTKCPLLVSSRTNIVNPAGTLDHPDIMFVGEGPGFYEDQQARPFVGDTGHTLAEIVTMLGIPRNRIALDNAIRCRPADNRTPTQDEIDNCHDYLITDIMQIQPRVIVTLGAPALKALYGNVPIKNVLGHPLVQPDTGIPLIPTYHPAYLMRDNWRLSSLVMSHIQKAFWLATGKLPPAQLGQYFTVKTLSELTQVVEYLDNVGLVFFDTETTGLDWMTDELLCLQLSGEAGSGVVIPFLHNAGEVIYKKVRVTKNRQLELMQGADPNEREALWLQYIAQFAELDDNAALFRDNREFNLGQLTEQPQAIPEKLPGTVEVPAGRTGKIEPFWPIEQYAQVTDAVQEILGSNVPKGAQNGIFDINMLERHASWGPHVKAATSFGFKIENVEFDSMLASKVVNEAVLANLTTLLSLYTSMPYYEEEINVQSNNKKNMAAVEDEVLWKYGGGDVDGGQRLEPVLNEKIDAQEGSRWLMDNIQMPLARMVVNLQRRGIYVDQDYFERLCAYYRQQEAAANAKCVEIVGHEVSLHWEHLQKFLYDELKLPLPSVKMDSAPRDCKKCSLTAACRKHAGTGKLALQELVDKSNHPVLPHVQALKQFSKLRSTYLDGSGEGGEGGYKRWIREDGRIHAMWGMRFEGHQVADEMTTTGRLNCQNPNLANIPNDVAVDSDEFNIHESHALKSIFCAPPGKTLLTVDWSQMEMWILAYRTGDKTLLDLLTSGRDIHVYVARELGRMGVNPHLFPAVDLDMEDENQWKKLHGDIRKRAKVFGFGTSYGLTDEGAAKKLGCLKEEAAPLLEAFTYNILPSLPAYFAEVEQLVTNPPYAVPNWAMRYRHFNEAALLKKLIPRSNRYQMPLRAIIREGGNHAIQSGAHDLHAAAWIALENFEPIMKWALPVLETHDSLTMETTGKPTSMIDKAWQVKNLFEETARNIITPAGVPLGWNIPVEVEWGRSLGAPEWKLTERGEILNMAEVKED